MLQKKRRSADDIVCYKILIKDRYGNLFSPLHPFLWKLNVEYKAERRWSPLARNEVKDGYFHTYGDRPSGRIVVSLPAHDSTVVLCKCIIPKGSYYYFGEHSNGVLGYASKKLKIVEIIHEYEKENS